MDYKTNFGELLSYRELLSYVDVLRREYGGVADRWISGPYSAEEFLVSFEKYISAEESEVLCSWRIRRRNVASALSLELVRFRFRRSRWRYGCMVYSRPADRICGLETILEGDGSIHRWLRGKEADKEGRPFADGSLPRILPYVDTAANERNRSASYGNTGEKFEELGDRLFAFTGAD